MWENLLDIALKEKKLAVFVQNCTSQDIEIFPSIMLEKLNLEAEEVKEIVENVEECTISMNEYKKNHT